MFRLLAAAALAVSAAMAADPILDRRTLQLPPDDQRQVHVEAITYRSGGLRIKGYLAAPARPGRYPCLLYNRGGNTTLGVWDDERATASLSSVAAWGYIVIASQYRGAGGSDGHDEFGGADVDDVLNLIPVLESLPNADPARIGIFGASRGGMMTYLALTKNNRLRTAVILSGLSDLEENARSRPEVAANVWAKLIPDFAHNRAEALRQRSAIRWVDKIPANVPLLLIHGTADWRVSPTEAFDMARALYEAKRPMRLVMYEGGSHGVPEFAAQRNALMQAWLDDYLRDGKKPDLTPHGN